MVPEYTVPDIIKWGGGIVDKGGYFFFVVVIMFSMFVVETFKGQTYE